MTPEEKQRLADRVEARQYAELCLAVIQPEPGQSETWNSVFWDTIRAAVIQTKPPEKPIGIVAMTDREAMMFEHAKMPFGRFIGTELARVPLPYLDWLAGQPEEFKGLVIRYLANPRVAAKLTHELEEREPVK